MSDEAVKVHPVIYDSYQSIRAILEKARSTAYPAVNFAMVQAYWEIGRVIVEEEQKGADRAEYGKAVGGGYRMREKVKLEDLQFIGG